MDCKSEYMKKIQCLIQDMHEGDPIEATFDAVELGATGVFAIHSWLRIQAFGGSPSYPEELTPIVEGLLYGLDLRHLQKVTKVQIVKSLSDIAHTIIKERIESLKKAVIDIECALISLLQDQEPEIRTATRKALWAIGTPSALAAAPKPWWRFW